MIFPTCKLDHCLGGVGRCRSRQFRPNHRYLLVNAKGKRWGFEVKYQDAPTITKSMRIAMQDLKLERL